MSPDPLRTQSTGAGASRVVIICSHEPELDPRIDWSARYAPSDIERIVVGFHDVRRAKPDEEVFDGIYRIVRLQRSQTRSVDSLARLVNSFFLHGPSTWRIAAALLLVFLGPVAVAYEILNVAYSIAGGGRARLRRWLRNIGLERIAVFAAMLIHFVQTNARLLECCRTLRPFRTIHANDLDTLIAAVFLKWETGCRVIYDSHEYWPYSDVNASRFEEIAWSTLERLLLRHVDTAFTVSGPLAQAIAAETGHEFRELPNAEPTTPAYEALAVSAATGDRVRFLFLGTFSPKRGLEELIQGWARLGDERAQLTLRGPDSPDREQLVSLAKKLGVFGRTVHFLESVHESELVTSAAQFDVGVIPYKPVSLAYRYCCPNKLSQYMQAGVAILTNNLGYVKDVVRRYQCGLAYDSSDLDTLASAIRQLVDDPTLLATLRRNAKKAARTDFNWQRQSAPLYEAYR